MAHQIIVQPDGKYAVFCTITDTLVAYDLNEKELKECVGNHAKDAAIRSLEFSLELLEKNPKIGASHFSQMTFEEALETHVQHEANCNDLEFNFHVRKLWLEVEKKHA